MDRSALPRLPLDELTNECSPDLVCPIGMKALGMLERQQRYLTPPESPNDSEYRQKRCLVGFAKRTFGR